MGLNLEQQLLSNYFMNEEYIQTIEEMKSLLLNRYDEIPRGDIGAYIWLRRHAGIEDGDLEYEERNSRHRSICQLLGFSSKGGLAGRDIEEY
jgi:hypothetical protein